MRISDWSSDVCSSDLYADFAGGGEGAGVDFIGADAHGQRCATAGVQYFLGALIKAGGAMAQGRIVLHILGLEWNKVGGSRPAHIGQDVAHDAFAGAMQIIWKIILRQDAQAGRSEEHPSELQSLMR